MARARRFALSLLCIYFKSEPIEIKRLNKTLLNLYIFNQLKYTKTAI